MSDYLRTELIVKLDVAFFPFFLDHLASSDLVIWITSKDPSIYYSIMSGSLRNSLACSIRNRVCCFLLCESEMFHP